MPERPLIAGRLDFLEHERRNPKHTGKDQKLLQVDPLPTKAERTKATTKAQARPAPDQPQCKTPRPRRPHQTQSHTVGARDTPNAPPDRRRLRQARPPHRERSA